LPTARAVAEAVRGAENVPEAKALLNEGFAGRSPAETDPELVRIGQVNSGIGQTAQTAVGNDMITG
jgi:hypothetical protein